jgi:hypothetical protein
LGGPAQAVRERDHNFSEYAYFSSFAESRVEHVRDYTSRMIDRFGFGPHSEVIELASNDVNFLQWFVKGGVLSLGIELAAAAGGVLRHPTRPTLVQRRRVLAGYCGYLVSKPALRAAAPRRTTAGASSSELGEGNALR